MGGTSFRSSLAFAPPGVAPGPAAVGQSRPPMQPQSPPKSRQSLLNDQLAPRNGKYALTAGRVELVDATTLEKRKVGRRGERGTFTVKACPKLSIHNPLQPVSLQPLNVDC